MVNIEDKELKKFDFPFNSIYTPVVPCVLDGNLSFLETVWKMLYDLNRVVNAVNANHEDIEQLATEINNLITDKLSVLWVEIDITAKPIKANKSFAEIKAAAEKGIVILKTSNSFAMLDSCTESLAVFNRVAGLAEVKYNINSDESVTIETFILAAQNQPATFTAKVNFNGGFIAKNGEFKDTVKCDALVTANAGVSVPTPTSTSSRSLATNIDYVGTVAQDTLVSAKSYAAQQDSINLTNATNYTNTKCSETLESATNYTNTKCSETLENANGHSDSGDATTLAQAKRYSDNHFSHITLTKNEDGTFSTDLAFSVIYLNITRGVLCDVRYSPPDVKGSVYVLYLSIYSPSKLTFIGTGDATALHVCTIDMNGTVTYS